MIFLERRGSIKLIRKLKTLGEERRAEEGI